MRGESFVGPAFSGIQKRSGQAAAGQDKQGHAKGNTAADACLRSVGISGGGNLHSRFLIAAGLAFLMLRALLGGCSFLVCHPFEGVLGGVGLIPAGALMPVAIFVRFLVLAVGMLPFGRKRDVSGSVGRRGVVLHLMAVTVKPALEIVSVPGRHRKRLGFSGFNREGLILGGAADPV